MRFTFYSRKKLGTFEWNNSPPFLSRHILESNLKQLWAPHPVSSVIQTVIWLQPLQSFSLLPVIIVTWMAVFYSFGQLSFTFISEATCIHNCLFFLCHEYSPHRRHISSDLFANALSCDSSSQGAPVNVESVSGPHGLNWRWVMRGVCQTGYMYMVLLCSGIYCNWFSVKCRVRMECSKELKSGPEMLL